MKVIIKITDLSINDFKNLNLNDIIKEYQPKIILDTVLDDLNEFITNNYEQALNLKGKGTKGTHIYNHYKKEVKNPLGRDTFYNELNKTQQFYKYRSMIYFNLKRI